MRTDKVNGVGKRVLAFILAVEMLGAGAFISAIGGMKAYGQETVAPSQADVFDVDFHDGTSTDTVSQEKPTVYGSPVIAESPALGRDTATFNGLSALSYKGFKDRWTADDDFSKQGSFECDFRYDSATPVQGAAYLCSTYESEASEGGVGMVLFGKKLTFQAKYANGKKYVQFATNPDQWYHAVGTWNDSALTLYVNGQKIGAASLSPNANTIVPPQDGDRNLVLGASPKLAQGEGANDSVYYQSYAEIAACKMYKTALDSDQVTASYQSVLGAAQTAKPLVIEKTAPEEGEKVTSAKSLDVQVQYPDILPTKVHAISITIDGTAHSIGDDIGTGQMAGEHQMEVVVRDVFGRTLDKKIDYSTTTIPKVSGANEDQKKGEVTLSASAQNPSGADIKTTFYGAKAQISNGGSQGIVSSVPTTLDFPSQNTSTFTSAMKPGDGKLVASQSAKPQTLPYQRFDLKGSGAVAGQHAVWTGKLDPEREVTMRLWNVKTASWDLVGQARGSSDGNVQVEAPIAGDDIDNGQVHVLMLGEDPFADDIKKSSMTFEDPSDYTFSIGHMTDTQWLTQGATLRPNPQERQKWSEAYSSMLQWFIDNQKKRKIAYVADTGDVIEDWVNSATQDQASRDVANQEFQVASQIQKRLDDSGIPYGIEPGNHDNLTGGESGPNDMFNQYFGPQRYEALEKSAGWKQSNASYHPYSATDNDDHYDLFTAGGLDFVAVYLGYGVTQQEADWAQRVFSQYKDRNGLLLTHAYNTSSESVDGKGSTFISDGDGKVILDRVLQDSPNVSLVMSGHDDGVATVMRRGDGKNSLHDIDEIQYDYQEHEVSSDKLGLTQIGGYSQNTGLRFGSAFLRLLQFNVKNSTVAVDTYSPMLNEYSANAYDLYNKYDDSAEHFTLPIQLNQRETSFETDAMALTVPGNEIGSARVRSGEPAQVAWAGLEPDEVYSWRALSRDASDDSPINPDLSEGIIQGGIFTATVAGTDKTPPVVTMPKETEIVQGSNFNSLDGVKITDNSGEDLRGSVHVIGTVDTSKPGRYPLAYEVEDGNGNQAIAVRLVVVTPKSSNGGILPGGTSAGPSSGGGLNGAKSNDTTLLLGGKSQTGVLVPNGTNYSVSSDHGSGALAKTGVADMVMFGVLTLVLAGSGLLMIRVRRINHE